MRDDVGHNTQDGRVFTDATIDGPDSQRRNPTAQEGVPRPRRDGPHEISEAVA